MDNRMMPGAFAGRLPVHYGWVVVIAGFLVLLSCLGLARFSFGVLLPPMAEALELNYAQRGYVGTGYFIGYLLMVGLAPLLGRRLGNRRAIVLGLALIAASMGLLGLAGSYVAALACYTVTGVGSGAANILMMALISRWFAPSMRGMSTGFMLAGNGTGIVLSGFAIPWVVEAFGNGDGWRAGWLLLAGACALLCVVVGLLLREAPEDLGLQMLGAAPKSSKSGTGAGIIPPPPDDAADRRFLIHLGSIYSLFGFTYIIFGTFFVTTLVDGHGYPEELAGRFWAWVGLFSLASGALFGKISDSFGRKTGLVATFLVQTVAYGLAGLHMDGAPLYASVALFGIAVWSIPTIVSATVADRLGPARAANGFAFVTFFFALGQVAGPTVAGWLADFSGGFAVSYMLSAGLTVLAALLGVLLPMPREQR